MATMFERIDILGCPFDALSSDEAEGQVRRALAGGPPLHIAVGNVDMVMKLRRDATLAEAFWASDISIADGVPITWAASLLGRPLKGRVAGTELVLRCAKLSAETGCSLARVGGKPAIAARAAGAMAKRFPGARAHVIETPFPLRPEHDASMIEAIRGHGARIILVALGAPRQELWVRRNLAASGAAVGIGIGSAFDIISGDKPWAPKWMRDNGLEWLHRLALEPRRLARRYLVDDMPFFGLLALEALRQRTVPRQAGLGN
jgi:N-acetylglucosaminyldiphosphoundecaprenol N-acetyl-beta-D-mannosaminyltransferase